MIRRWNEHVGDNDVVHHLGDFTLGGANLAKYLFGRLKGRISILRGSHDSSWYKKPKFVFTSMSGHEVIRIGTTAELDLSVGPVAIHHYAQRVWWLSHYGSYHLYGHSHGRLPGIGRSMDVGVDCNDFRPINLEAIVVKLKNKRNSNQID